MIFSDDLTLKWDGFLWKNRVDKKKVEWCYNIGDQLHGVIKSFVWIDFHANLHNQIGQSYHGCKK